MRYLLRDLAGICSTEFTKLGEELVCDLLIGIFFGSQRRDDNDWRCQGGDGSRAFNARRCRFFGWILRGFLFYFNVDFPQLLSWAKKVLLPFPVGPKIMA